MFYMCNVFSGHGSEDNFVRGKRAASSSRTNLSEENVLDTVSNMKKTTFLLLIQLSHFNLPVIFNLQNNVDIEN